MIRILLTYLLLMSFTSFSQDLRSEFVQMNEYLEELVQFKISVNYSADDTQEVEKGTISAVVHPKGLLYSLGEGSGMMVNKKNTVLIEPSEQQLVYSNNQKVKEDKSISLIDKMLQGIDTLIARCDTVIFHREGDQRVYNLRFKNAYFDLVQLYFTDRFISKAVYFYNEEFVEYSGSRATCNLWIDPEVEIDEELFETSYYLEKEAGQMKASEKFKNYKIVYNESLEEILD